MRITIVIFCLILTISANGQFTKGNLIAGAEHQVTYSRINNIKPHHLLSLGASISYFLTPSTSVGIMVSESFGTESAALSRQNQMYGAGIGAKHYFKFNEFFGTWVGASFAYAYGENDRPLIGTSILYMQSFTLRGSPGIYARPFSKILMETSFSLLNVSSTRLWNDGPHDVASRSATGTMLEAGFGLHDLLEIQNLSFSVYWLFISGKK